MPYLSKQAHVAIRSVAQKWSWPGGYPVFAVMADGEGVCPDCLKENLKLIVQATHDGGDPQWAVEEAEVNWENPRKYCCNCNSRIPSAYAEDQRDWRL